MSLQASSADHSHSFSSPGANSRFVAVYVLCQIIILVVFYYPFLAGKQTFIYQDSTNFFEPLCSFIGRTFSVDRLPLWNPYNYCGMPQIAVSSPGICSPFSWLFALADYSRALAVIMILCQLICGTGTFLLVLSVGWGMLPAVLCGIIMSMNGYMFSLSSNYSLLASASWFPVCLWSVNRLQFLKVSASVRHHIVILAISIFMLISGGRPEIWLVAMILIVSYGILRSCSVESRYVSATLSPMLKAIVVGVLLAAPMLLPALEWMPLSRRADGLAASESLLFSANWYHILDMFVLHPLGDLQSRLSDFKILIQPRNIDPYVGSAYVGPIVFCLAVIGLQKGRLFYWCTLAALALLLIASLGANVPGISQLVDAFPALGLFRFPSKLLFYVIFFLTLFAARGLRLYLENKTQLPAILLITTAIAISAVALLVVPNFVLPFIPNDAVGISSRAQKLIGQSLLLTSVSSIFVILAMHWFANKNRAMAASVAIFVVFVGLITHACMYYRQGGPSNYYARTSSVSSAIDNIELHEKAASRNFRILPLLLERFSVPTSFASSDPHTSTVQSFQYSRNMLRPFTNIDFKLASSFGFEGAMVGEYYYLLLNDFLKCSQACSLPVSTKAGSRDSVIQDVSLAHLLQMTATKYVITQQCLSNHGERQDETEPLPKLDANFFDLMIENRNDNFRIYKVLHSLPRAYLSYAWKTLDSRDEVIRRIADTQTSSFRPESETLLERSNLSVSEAENSGGDFDVVSIVEKKPEEIQMVTNSSRSSLLVLADQYYPGWCATVDGVDAPILRCNGFFKAVHLQSGQHSILFTYKPMSFTGGLFVSLLAFIWLYIIVKQQDVVKDESIVVNGRCN
jgi:hypothetical protein